MSTITDEEPIESGSRVNWHEPKATPPDDHDAVLETEPQLIRINKRLIVGVLATAAVVGLGSVVYAMANRTHRVRAASGTQAQPYPTASARMPDGLRQFKFATTPATAELNPLAPIRPVQPDVPQSAIDALPVTHTAPPISTAYDEGVVTQGEDYTPRNYRPRSYGARNEAKADDVDHSTDEADLPSKQTFSGKSSGRAGQQDGLTVPSLPLGQAPTGMPSLPGGEQLGKLAQALASAQADGDDDTKKERFMARDGIETLDSSEDELAECDLSAGRPIPSNVLVAINSDLPSGNTVCATVTETVYCGADRQHIGLPQGARFCGEVNHSVVYGQDRIQLCMKQLERPPSAGHPRGSRKQLGCMVVADITGAAGMPADVDNHWSQVISGALLSTVLSLGTSVSMGNQEGFAPTLAQNAAHSAGANISQVGQRIVQRDLQRKPTLKTEQLEGVMIMFTRNLELEPWLPRRSKHRG